VFFGCWGILINPKRVEGDLHERRNIQGTTRSIHGGRRWLAFNNLRKCIRKQEQVKE